MVVTCRAPRKSGDASVSEFWPHAGAGRQLARLHLDYDRLDPCPLKVITTYSVPLLHRVGDKMRLSNHEPTRRATPMLALRAPSPKVLQSRLGNRGTLEWLIDGYQVSEDKRTGTCSDSNRADNPENIVHLVGQVVRLSLETIRIVAGLPERCAE